MPLRVFAVGFMPAYEQQPPFSVIQQFQGMRRMMRCTALCAALQYGALTCVDQGLHYLGVALLCCKMEGGHVVHSPG